MGVELTELQQKVFLDRYALRDREGNLLEHTVEEMWRRVAKMVARAEEPGNRQEWEDKFYWLLEDFKFVPAGRVLNGTGTMMNCFVLPRPHDSRQGIMKALQETIEIMSHGGGVGIDLSSLRPKDTAVRGVNGLSSGAVSWGELFSDATGKVSQGGSRRGAMLLGMQVWHPDILDFIEIKQDLSRCNNANLSVLITDDFMEAVERNRPWELRFPATDEPNYDKNWTGDLREWLGPIDTYDKFPARDLWERITDSAWRCGEPGVIFIDRCNRVSNTKYFSQLICTNPCGEQPLGAYECCNLGSVNLNALSTARGEMDGDILKDVVSTAVRFLDDVIDVCKYPLPETERAAKESRRIGLGFMGVAHWFFKKRVRYGSDSARMHILWLYEYLHCHGYRASVELAKEKGSFAKFDVDHYYRYYNDLGVEHGLRNATITTQAPTGTTSLLAGTSSGIEPVFKLAMKRKDRMGEHVIHDPVYAKWLQKHPDDPKPDYFVEAAELKPEEHVLMQAAAQQWVDASISKTVNAPSGHTVEDCRKTYILAWAKGCKGITYYRDGSREGVLTGIDEDKPKPDTTPSQAVTDIPRPRPNTVHGSTTKVDVGCGKLYVTVNSDDKGICEIFADTGKKGGCPAQSEATARIASIALRCGVPVFEITKQLRGIRCLNCKGVEVLSCPDAIGRVLEDRTPVEIPAKQDQETASSPSTCPECENELSHDSGCVTCPSCGYSQCG